MIFLAALKNSSDQESRQNQAFALKLTSAKLEQEHQNRMSEMQSSVAGQESEASFKLGLSSVPADQFNKIAKYATDSAQALRDRKPFPQIDASDVSHPAAQQMLERVQGQLAHASAAMLPVSLHPINTNGHSIMNIYDKGGNLVSTQDNGLNPEGMAAVQKAETAYGTYSAGLRNARSKLNSFLTAKSAGMLPEQVAKLTIDSYLQDNPDVKTYFDQLPLMALKGELDLTHSARAVAALGKSAADAYPGKGNTIGVAMDKLDSLDKVGRDGLDTAYHVYGVDPKQQHYPNYNLQEELKQQKDAGAKGQQDGQNQSRLQRLQSAYQASQQTGK